MELKHLYPTLEMLAEELNRMGVACRVERGAETRTEGDGTGVPETGEVRFRGARRFAGKRPERDIISVLGPGEASAFPADDCACVSAVPIPGKAGCILCMNRSPEAILDALLDIFDRCREMEARLDGLVYGGGSLAALCEMGASMLENPICVHDDWFVMLARSAELPEVMPPDYIMSSSKEFIPRIIVEDFKNDGEYLETYVHRTARLWARDGAPRCLYANLWDGGVYRGRLLVVEYRRGFRRLDYALAELLAQRALSLMNRRRPGLDPGFRSTDDIVMDLLNGKRPELQEENRLLEMLDWRREDALICVRLEAQQQGAGAVLEHALHSDLFQEFPNGYVLFSGHQQCLLLNAGRESATPAMLRHRLAPLCRDYCLYAGMSSPVTGIRELSVAYLQSKLALERAFRLRDDRWMVLFSDCALEYLMEQVKGQMSPRHLVAPELCRLIEHDAREGTRYYETLRAYLLNERDIPRTSQTLIIHRTTLLYRLKKMKEVVPIDWDDPDRRLLLGLSIWILDKGIGGRE